MGVVRLEPKHYILQGSTLLIRQHGQTFSVGLWIFIIPMSNFFPHFVHHCSKENGYKRRQLLEYYHFTQVQTRGSMGDLNVVRSAAERPFAHFQKGEKDGYNLAIPTIYFRALAIPLG